MDVVVGVLVCLQKAKGPYGVAHCLLKHLNCLLEGEVERYTFEYIIVCSLLGVYVHKVMADLFGKLWVNNTACLWQVEFADTDCPTVWSRYESSGEVSEALCQSFDIFRLLVTKQ